MENPVDPADTPTAAPRRSIASSSSSGVRWAVPSSMVSASRLATPVRPGASKSMPPWKRSSKCTIGVSRSSTPRTTRPPSSVSRHTSGARTLGEGPKGGSTERSKEPPGVRSSPLVTVNSASAPWMIGSITTSARSEPSSASSAWPRGTKLLAMCARSLM